MLITLPSPNYYCNYMEYAINGFHRKILFNFNDKKVDHFLIGLKQIYGVITLAYQNLSLFSW